MNLDAYTVRKAIPRILVAVIGINISIYLCVAAIGVTNIIGHGLAELIAGPFVQADSFRSVGIEGNIANGIATGGLLISGIVGGGALAVAIWSAPGFIAVTVLLPFILAVALITLAILFTLVIRQGLLIFLTIISPVAIALFVLPGTEKYFKQWLSLFIKTLMVYPIIASIFAVSSALAAILLGTAGGSPDTIGLAKIIAAVVVVFAPLVMIPFAFKLAGGAIGQIFELANARAGSAAGRAKQGLKKWGDDPNSWAGKSRSKGLRKREDRGLTSNMIMSGLSRGLRERSKGESFRQGYTSGAYSSRTTASQAQLAELEKLADFAPIKGNDDALMVGASFKDENGVWRARTRQEQDDYLTAMGYTDKNARDRIIASVDRAKSATTQEGFDQFAAVHLPGTGTGFKGGGFAEMAEFVEHAAGGDRALEGNLVAAGRSKAQEARRFDLVPGFGTHMGLMQERRDFKENGRLSDAGRQKILEEEYDGDIDAYLNGQATDNVLFTQGAGAIVGGRGDSVKNLTESVNRRMRRANETYAEATATYDGVMKNPYSTEEQKSKAVADFEKATKNRKRVLAATAGMLDVAAQISPENAELLADGGRRKYTDARGHAQDEEVAGVLTQTMGRVPIFETRNKVGADGNVVMEGGKPVVEQVMTGYREATVAEEIEFLRSDPEFGQYRREYANSTQAQAANMAAASAAAASGQPPVTPVGPGVPGLG